MTSLGTYRLVMPLSESAMAKCGPFAIPAATDASICDRSSAGTLSARSAQIQDRYLGWLRRLKNVAELRNVSEKGSRRDQK